MPQNRFYLDSPLTQGEHVVLIDQLSHLRVMRKKQGQSVELVNGKNRLALAQIDSVSKNQAELTIMEAISYPAKMGRMILCQALCESNRLDLILEKCTEIGADEFWLFPGVLSKKTQVSAHGKKRMEAIVISAMKQSGRLDLPKISLMPELAKWEKENFLEKSYFGTLAERAPHLLDLSKDEQSIQFFVGPPSGFTEDEERLLKSNGVQGVQLNRNTLRTETAAIVATTLLIIVDSI